MAAPALTGQDIGEAEGAVHGLLEAVLDGAEVSADEYVMLRVLTLHPAMTAKDAYDFFGSQRQMHRTREELAAMLRGLADRRLISGLDGKGPVMPTERGAELHATLFDRVGEVTKRLYGGLDPAELAQAKQTLARVAQRAHALRRELSERS